MKVHLSIVTFDGEPLPPGGLVKIEVRDTSLADAAAVLLQRKELLVPKLGRTTVLPVSIDVAEIRDGTTIWAHIDVDRDGRVSKHDYVTVESYPLANVPSQNIQIRVRRVT